MTVEAAEGSIAELERRGGLHVTGPLPSPSYPASFAREQILCRGKVPYSSRRATAAISYVKSTGYGATGSEWREVFQVPTRHQVISGPCVRMCFNDGRDSRAAGERETTAAGIVMRQASGKGGRRELSAPTPVYRSPRQDPQEPNENCCVLRSERGAQSPGPCREPATVRAPRRSGSASPVPSCGSSRAARRFAAPSLPG